MEGKLWLSKSRCSYERRERVVWVSAGVNWWYKNELVSTAQAEDWRTFKCELADKREASKVLCQADQWRVPGCVGRTH